MNGPSKWQNARPCSGATGRPGRRLGYMVVCLALFTIAMEGVRFYAHESGFIGGLLSIAAMYGSARWYERRRNNPEIASEEQTDDRSR